MSTLRIKLSIFLNYFVFAILLNSVGTVILLVQTSFNVSKSQVAVLEPFKDMSIAIVSFLVTSFITRIGYKKAMLIALGFISIVCFAMPFSGSLLMVELLFASIGSSFALIKMSVYGSIGLITNNEKDHISFMNFVESFFGVGIVVSYFIFPLFIDKNDAASTSWLRVYFLLGGISLLAFILLFISPLDESASKSSEPSEDMLNDFGKMFRLFISPLVRIFIFCAFFYVLLEQSIMSWLPTFNNDVLKLNQVLSIQMASILAGSIAVGRFVAGILLKKFNWLAVLIVCLLCAGSLVIFAMPAIKEFLSNYKGSGITRLADVPLIAYVFPLIGLVLAPVYPAINSVILSSLPKPKHGLMAGLIIVFSALGGSTGSLITGNIFQAYGGQTAMYFSIIPIGILIICLFIFSRIQKKSTTAPVTFNAAAGH